MALVDPAASFSMSAAPAPQRPPGLVWQSAALKTHAVICAGTSTAPSSTSKAKGQAGTSTSKRSSPSGWPTLVAMIGFSPTMSMMQRCEGSETLSPAKRSLSTCKVSPLPESCRRPASPLSVSGRPATLATSGAEIIAAFPATVPAFDAAPAFFFLTAGAGAPAGLPPARSRQNELRGRGACAKQETANQNRSAPVHCGRSRSRTRKEKAFCYRSSPVVPAPKNPRFPRLAPRKALNLYTPGLAGFGANTRRIGRNRRRTQGIRRGPEAAFGRWTSFSWSGRFGAGRSRERSRGTSNG